MSRLPLLEFSSNVRLGEIDIYPYTNLMIKLILKEPKRKKIAYLSFSAKTGSILRTSSELPSRAEYQV